MEASEYFSIVAITVSMMMGAHVLFFGIKLRSKGSYRAGWTDAPLNGNYKMVTFNGGMTTFTGGGCSEDCSSLSL